MRRAERQTQILQLRNELEGQRHSAQELSRQPLALINRHPAITITLSALALGVVTRVALSKSLPTVIKIVGVPLLRQVAIHAWTALQQTRQTKQF
ncbi:MAG: hypothetical protein Q7L07_11925 [Pseudohongiella sp.]|nr:hypothetical protein [Pseudohongiella sp.]